MTSSLIKVFLAMLENRLVYLSLTELLMKSLWKLAKICSFTCRYRKI